MPPSFLGGFVLQRIFYLVMLYCTFHYIVVFVLTIDIRMEYLFPMSITEVVVRGNVMLKLQHDTKKDTNNKTYPTSYCLSVYTNCLLVNGNYE